MGLLGDFDVASASLLILFNWQAAGWCLGKITRANTDGRIVREGVPANFFVYYEIDEEEAKHSLELVEHGHQEVPNAWGTFGQGGGMTVLLHVLYLYLYLFVRPRVIGYSHAGIKKPRR